MLLRLLIIQFHDTKPDRLVQAQATIDRHVAALVQQLNDATMEITSFRHRAASDLGGTVHDLVRSLADVREMIAEEYRTMANTMRESFEIPHEMLTAEVTKLAATLEIQGEGFERAAQRLETSLIRATDTATAIGDSLHASDALKQVGAAINELSGKIKDRSEQFVHMTTALEKSRAELDGQLHSLHELRSAVATVSSHLSAFETELREVSSASISVEVKNGLMNVQQAINSTLEASKAIESTMRGVLFFMRDRVTEEHPSGRN
jgi:chromosome segregation ATPase